MAWQVKNGIPEYVSWLESARVAILGTSYEWVGEYFWLLSERTLSTADFCALGPLECEDLVPGDFLGLIGAGRVGGGLQAATLGAKLQCFLQQKMFAAYCENTEGSACTLLATRVAGAPTEWGTYPAWIFVRQAVPANYSTIRIRQTDGPGTGLGSVDTLNPDNSLGVNIIGSGHTAYDELGNNYWEMPWSGEYWGIHVNGGPPGSNWILQGCVEGGGAPYVAPELARPDYALSPPSQTYDDIASLGAELDNLERKLHVVMEQGVSAQIDRQWPLALDGDVVPAESDEDVELDDIQGVVVSLSNIGNQVDERFGEPRELHRVGRIVFGTATAWLAPLEITVTPELFVGLPPGIVRMRLHLLPPTTGTYQLLKRAKPLD